MTVFMPEGDVQIEFLADRREFIPLLAEWHQREWASLRPGFSIADRVAMLHERSRRSELPITLVASSGEELLGSAMLIQHDMDTRPDYTPWLAGVFVSPGHRHRGIGRALSERVVREAARLGFATLYLYTPSARDFYSRLGWSILERMRYRDTEVTIMSYTQVINC
jgi:GNAT superfamily N-acetyltransferase